MCNELEKKFFDTFGIKPEKEQYCYHECKNPELKNIPCHKLCKYQRFNVAYPQITDTTILKLMCVIANFDERHRGFYTKYETIKEEVLFELLMIFDALTICPWSKPYINIPGGAAKLICEIRKVFNYKGEHK